MSSFAQNTGTFVRGKKTGLISANVLKTPYTLSVFYTDGGVIDVESSSEIKAKISADLKKMGVTIIDGDMISHPEEKTILVSSINRGTVKKMKLSFLVEVRDYKGPVAKSTSDEYYTFQSSSYDKMVSEFEKAILRIK